MEAINNQDIKLLIVDDTAQNLEAAGKILEKENYDIYVADSGATALELISNVNFDLILLDIMMPVMDGFETCINIKKNRGKADIPIIFLTANVDSESVLEGMGTGAVDYLKKPFNEMELVFRVRNSVALKKTREELELKNSKLQEANDMLQEIATTDHLTKLLNRREILKRIEYEKTRWERNKIKFSVIMADVDFFKKINDEYGHDGGDFVLKSIAATIKSCVRKQDFVSRWGGEEFILLLPDTGLEGAKILAEKLRKTFEKERFLYYGHEIGIKITLGVSTYSDGNTIEELIGKADKALYAGKNNGRNCVEISG